MLFLFIFILFFGEPYGPQALGGRTFIFPTKKKENKDGREGGADGVGAPHPLFPP
jgi:hypothetical protein